MSHPWLAILCLLLMTAFIILEHREKWVAGVILKGAASLCFVLFGLFGSKGCADAGFARLVVTGLAVGAVADVLLNLRYVFTERAKLLFAGGTLVFLAGHVIYSVAVWPRATMPWLFVALGVVVTAIAMRVILSRIQADGSLKVIGVFYVGIVVILNCLALSALIARHDAQSLTLFAGALLFLASDIILILNTFGGDFQFRRRALNLSLYYVGQVLIALALHMG